MPTQKEIARLAGVSQVTVNAVLNGSNHTRTKPETREQILAIAKKLNYRIQRHARLMRTGKSQAIALVTSPAIVETAYLRLNFAAAAVRDSGYFPHIHDVSWRNGDFVQTWEEVLQGQPEGILLVGPIPLIDSKIRKLITSSKIPTVSISGPYLDNIPLLIPDFQQGFSALTQHLIARGRKRITLVMRKPTYQKAFRWQDERRLGYLNAMRDKGLKPKVIDLSIKRPEQNLGLLFRDRALIDHCVYGYDFAKTGLPKLKGEDCWMFFNDAWALGALRALGEAGISIPDGMAVTGCDGQTDTRYGYLPLTTLAQPVRALADEGTELLLEMIKNKENGRELIRRLPCELLVGATS